MSDIVIYPHLEIAPDTVDPNIAGRRLTVRFMSIFLNDPEWTVDRICEEYNLVPAQVYAAWTYYYDHKEAIDRIIAEDNEAYDRLTKDPEIQANIRALKQHKHNRQG